MGAKLMAVVFTPDEVEFGDQYGFGRWLNDHYFEHLRFAQILASQATPYYVPDYSLNAWDNDPAFVSDWLNSHQNIHNSLRAITGISGIDLTAVDLRSEGQFYVWLDDHAAEHQLIRTALGAV